MINVLTIEPVKQMKRLLALLSIVVITTSADAERLRKDEPGRVTFYVGPKGDDTDNGCQTAERPCTLQGAQNVAKKNWDFSGSGCFIHMLPGVYRGAAANVVITSCSRKSGSPSANAVRPVGPCRHQFQNMFALYCCRTANGLRKVPARYDEARGRYRIARR
jgi:hypothetical protein